MTSQLKFAQLYAHRANIDRYRKLMTTTLAVRERAFIEQWVGEEKQALHEIEEDTAQPNCPDAE